MQLEKREKSERKRERNTKCEREAVEREGEQWWTGCERKVCRKDEARSE